MFKRAWLKVKYSIWLKPAWLTVASLLLAVLTGLIDSGRWFALADIMPDFMLTGVELAKTILGVTSGAMLSMTVFTFSTTMVVLTTYSSQYSPRVVRNFLTDDETVQTLGIFMGGFVYSIMALSFMKTSLNGRPVISANLSILYVIACLVQFLKYVNHVSSYIQVKNLIQRLHDHAGKCILDYRKFLEKGKIVERFQQPLEGVQVQLAADDYGYIRLINYSRLTRLAEELECCIQVPVITGVFVTEGRTLLIAWHQGDESFDVEKFRSCFTIGNEPLEDQDFLFSIQKISEITLRSISPGINDPNTAIHCLKIAGVLLSELADLEHGWLIVRKGESQSDPDAQIICAFELIDFEKIVYYSFYQIVHYGRNDISVVLAMIKALGFIMHGAAYSNRQHIMIFLDYIWDKLPEDLKSGHDLVLLEQERAEALAQ